MYAYNINFMPIIAFVEISSILLFYIISYVLLSNLNVSYLYLSFSEVEFQTV